MTNWEILWKERLEQLYFELSQLRKKNKNKNNNNKSETNLFNENDFDLILHGLNSFQKTPETNSSKKKN